MAVVYVVQKQLMLDRETGDLVPRFDLSAADEYGPREFLLSPNAKPFEPAPIARDLHRSLKNFTADDFLLLVGNPVLIGMATAVAAYYSDGVVNFLQWHGKERRYVAVTADIDEPVEAELD